MKKLSCLLVGFLLGSAAAHGAPRQDISKTAAEKFDGLTIYTTLRSYQAVEELFEKQTGAKVRFLVSRSSEVLNDLQKPVIINNIDAVWLYDMAPLSQLPQNLWSKLPTSLKSDKFMPSSQTWLPLNVVHHNLMYHYRRVKSDQLPKTIWDLPKHKELKGKVGWAVGSSDFINLVAEMMAQRGETQTRTWLKSMLELEPRDYGGEASALAIAMHNEEIDVAPSLNQWVRRAQNSRIRVTNHFFAAGDAGNLIRLSGAAVAAHSKHKQEALKFLSLLNQPAVQLFVYTRYLTQPVSAGPLVPRGLIPTKDLGKLNPSYQLTPERADLREKATDLLIDLDIL